MSVDTLADAFVEELRDILSAEKQLLRALPKMIKKATSEELCAALENHLGETEVQIERIETAFEETGLPAKARTCEAMKGLVKEAEEMLKEVMAAEVRDAMIIACAQKVEHYEIATYGTLCAWAVALQYDRALQLLKANMADEVRADKALTGLSKAINRRAAEARAEAEASA
jgi:ferritin-like metal-binding protein YciE